MTTFYFGERWDAPMLNPPDDDSPPPVHCPTPVGEPCLFCKELIAMGDRGLIVGASMITVPIHHGAAPIHIECEMLGTIGHIYAVCPCTGFDTTSRASALELLRRMNVDRAKHGMGPL